MPNFLDSIKLNNTDYTIKDGGGWTLLCTGTMSDGDDPDVIYSNAFNALANKEVWIQIYSENDSPTSHSQHQQYWFAKDFFLTKDTVNAAIAAVRSSTTYYRSCVLAREYAAYYYSGNRDFVGTEVRLIKYDDNASVEVYENGAIALYADFTGDDGLKYRYKIYTR